MEEGRLRTWRILSKARNFHREALKGFPADITEANWDSARAEAQMARDNFIKAENKKP